MQFNLEKIEKNLVSLMVETTVEEVEEALAESYKKVVHKVSVPGFRKGHTPRNIIERNYGKEVLYEDALDILLPKAYLKGLEEYNLQPIEQPKLEVIKEFEAGEVFSFKATFEVLPEVKLGKYKGLEVEKTITVIDEAQVEASLKDLQIKHAELVLSEKETLENGDFAVIDFEGYLDGQPFQGGAAQAYTLEIGSGSFVPGFEEQLIGMTIGSEKDINVTFPADYNSQALAGKETNFKVALKEIKVKELPVLDDEFAKSLGKYETIADLKKAQQEKMELMAKEEAENKLYDSLLGKLVDNSEVELSELLIKNELETMVHNFEHNLAYQGLDLETYLQYSQKTIEEVQAEFAPEAERRVKTDLVLGAIAKAEGLQVTPEELDMAVNDLAKRYQYKNVAKFKKELAQKGKLENIEQDLLLKKTADFIKEQAVIKTV